MFYEDSKIKSFSFLLTYIISTLKGIQDYEVKTGRPIVAVVIKAPAKIKKGR